MVPSSIHYCTQGPGEGGFGAVFAHKLSRAPVARTGVSILGHPRGGAHSPGWVGPVPRNAHLLPCCCIGHPPPSLGTGLSPGYPAHPFLPFPGSPIIDPNWGSLPLEPGRAGGHRGHEETRAEPALRALTLVSKKGPMASGGEGTSVGLWAPRLEMIGRDKLTAGTKPCEIDLITSDQIRLFSVRGMFSWVMT